MGFLEKLLPRPAETATKTAIADTLTGIPPVSGTMMISDVLLSDAVSQCVRCITREVSKLRPVHLRNALPVTGQGSLQDLLTAPNQLMGTADFLEKVAYLYLMDDNCYILPSYTVYKDSSGTERRIYHTLYPISPQRTEFVQDATNRLFIRFYFAKPDYTVLLPYSDVIHIRGEYGANEVFGGGVMGVPDRRSLLKAVNLNEKMLDTTEKAAETSGGITGIIKYHGIINEEKTKAAARDFERRLANSKTGLLVVDDSSSYQDFQRQIKLVDADTLKFIDSKICRAFGVSLPILTGDYTKPQFEAFYQAAIEPLVIKLNQAFTGCLFTDRERAFGNEVKFLTADLEFVTMSEKLNLINGIAGQSGVFMMNEIRQMLGLRPDPELEGKRMISLNYIESKDAFEDTNDKKENETTPVKEDENDGKL